MNGYTDLNSRYCLKVHGIIYQVLTCSEETTHSLNTALLERQKGIYEAVNH